MAQSGVGSRPQVMIVGAGFAGLHAAKGLRRAPVRVTVVDRRNFHLFQPLPYQVATGGLSPGDIASPVRAVLKAHRNTTTIAAEVIGLDPEKRRVQLAGGHLEYDTLILAAGSTHHYFGNDAWAPLAPGLKSIEDALEIRRRVLLAFETAERESDEHRRRAQRGVPAHRSARGGGGSDRGVRPPPADLPTEAVALRRAGPCPAGRHGACRYPGNPGG